MAECPKIRPIHSAENDVIFCAKIGAAFCLDSFFYSCKMNSSQSEIHDSVMEIWEPLRLSHLFGDGHVAIIAELNNVEFVYYAAATLTFGLKKIHLLPEGEKLLAVLDTLQIVFPRESDTRSFWKNWKLAESAAQALERDAYYITGLMLFRTVILDFVQIWTELTFPTFADVRLDIEDKLAVVLNGPAVDRKILLDYCDLYDKELIRVNRVPFDLALANDELGAPHPPNFSGLVTRLVAYQKLKPLVEKTRHLQSAWDFCIYLKAAVEDFKKAPPVAGDILKWFALAHTHVHWYNVLRFQDLPPNGLLSKLLKSNYSSHKQPIPTFIHTQLHRLNRFCVRIPLGEFSQYCPPEPPAPSEYRFDDAPVPCLICPEPVHVGVSGFCQNPQCATFNNDMIQLVHYQCLTSWIWAAFYKDNRMTWKIGTPPPNANCITCSVPIDTANLKTVLKTVLVLPAEVGSRLSLPTKKRVKSGTNPAKKQKIIDVDSPKPSNMEIAFPPDIAVEPPSLWQVAKGVNKPV